MKITPNLILQLEASDLPNMDINICSPEWQTMVHLGQVNKALENIMGSWETLQYPHEGKITPAQQDSKDALLRDFIEACQEGFKNHTENRHSLHTLLKRAQRLVKE